MKPKYKALVLLLPVLLICHTLSAQTENWQGDDFGIWLTPQITKNWDNGMYVSLLSEFQSCLRTNTVGCWFVRPTIGYKPLKWLSIDASYDFMLLPESHQIMHDFLFSVTGVLKRENLSVLLRERYQFAYGQQTHKFVHTLRTFLKVQYQIGTSRFAPYAAIELYTWKNWKSTRHYVGTDLKVSKHTKFDLYYMYYTFADKRPNHVLGIGYVATF